MAYNRGFDKLRYDIQDIRVICQWVWHNLMESKTLPLVETRLSSSTLVIVGKQVRFQVLVYETAKTCYSRTCQS